MGRLHVVVFAVVFALLLGIRTLRVRLDFRVVAWPADALCGGLEPGRTSL